MKKRALALLLALVMVFSCLPLTVFAVEEDEELAVVEETPIVEEVPVEEAAPIEETPIEEAPAVEEPVEAPAAEQAEPAEEAEPETVEVLNVPVEGNILTAENFPDEGLLSWLLAFTGGYMSVEDAKLVEQLPIAGAGSLTGLAEYFPNVMYLYIYECNLTTITLSGWANLFDVTIMDNADLTAVTISGCPALSFAAVHSNDKLTSLTVSGCTALVYLACYSNSLKTLALSSCPNLQSLDCSENQLKALDLTSFTKLGSLYCNNNELSTLNISGLSLLSDMNCDRNHLTSLNLTGCGSSNNFYGGEQTTAVGYLPAVVLGGENIIRVDEIDLSDIRGSDIDDLYGFYYPGNTDQYIAVEGDYIKLYVMQSSDFGLDIRIALDIVGEPKFYGGDYYLMESGDSWGEESFPASRPDDYPYWVVAEAEYVPIDTELNPADYAFVGTDYFGEFQLDAMAACTGTVYLRWYIPELDNDSPETTASFRLDICDRANPITGVSLGETKKTVELFKDEYASFDILLEMDQLLTLGNTKYVGTETPEDIGYTLNYAEFVTEDGTSSSLNEYFSLVCAGDRSIQIVPTGEAIQAALNNKKSISSSYSSALKVVLYYHNKCYSYQTAPITLTVKQTMPSLKAKAVSLNSFYSETEAIASCTGGVFVPGGVCETVSLPVKGLSAAIDEYGCLKITYKAFSMVKKTYTLKLECQVEGWRVTAPLSVKVSISPIIPKMSLSKSSVTITAGMDDAVTVGYKVNSATEAAYPELCPDGFNVLDSKGNECYNVFDVWFDYDTKQIVINGIDAGPDDAGTYTVEVSYMGSYKPLKLKVKVVAYKQPKLNYSVSGAIDLTAMTYAEGGTAVVITPTISGVNKYCGVYPGTFSVIATRELYRGKTCIDSREIPDTFYLSAMDSTGNIYMEYGGSDGIIDPQLLKDNGLTAKYLVTLTYTYYANGMANTIEGPAKAITVKASSKLTPSVSLKQTGNIDPLHVYAEDSEITLTYSYKNLPYGAQMEDQELVFYKKEGKTWVELTDEDYNPFYYDWALSGYADYTNGSETCYAYEGNLSRVYIIRVYDPYALTQAYAVRLRVYNYRGFLCETPITALNLKAGKVKFVADKTAVTLLLKDRYDVSDGVIALDMNPGCSGINYYQLDAASSQWFEVVMLSNGAYAIKWKDNTLPTGWKNGTTKTVTVSLYVAGSLTCKPNATLKFKVTALSQPTVTEPDIY